MDSGSGSLQSSSGGDEEYDSAHQPPLIPPPPSFSFHNIIPPSHIGSSIIPPQIPFHNFQNLPPNFYDFSSNYSNLQPHFNPDANSFPNLDPPLRPTSQPTAAAVSPPTQNQPPVRGGPSSAPAGLHPKVSTKKRTRASRRAPTTVLTTDTSNFRAMVQEFTGIPSPPFSAGGSSYSRRFDLFTSRTTAGTNLEPSGSGGFYPSRSKAQQVSPLLNNVMVERETMSNMQQTPGGIFSLQSLSGHDFNSTNVEAGQSHSHSHIDGSGQLLSALQNDEIWKRGRPNNNNTANCKLNFSSGGSSSNKEMGNIVSSTVDSWICPSD